MVRRVRMIRGLALVAETGLWHWFPLAAALFGGGGLLVLVAVVTTLDLASVVLLDRLDGFRAARAPGAARVVAWYVAVHRVVTAISQAPGLYSAFHVAPIVTAAAAIASTAWLVVLASRRAPTWLPGPTRALTLSIATSLAVNVSAFAGWLGTDCGEVLSQPGVRPLVLFERVAGRPANDPLLDLDCEVARVITVDPADATLLVACGPEVTQTPRHAVLRVDPARPEARQALVDKPAIEALAIPGSDLVAVSVFGGDVLRFVDRTSFARRGEIPMRRPLGLAWDERAQRLLVGHEGEPGCVAAVDPFTFTRQDGHVSMPSPSAAELRTVYPDSQKSQACLPDNCSPSHIVPLPEAGVVMVGNSSATCTWQAMSYDGLERVYAAEWLFPARDVVRSPSGDEVWVAISFPGKLAVLSAKTLALRREIPIGYGAWWFDWLDDGDVVVGDYVTGELRRIDSASGRVRAHAHVGSKVREVLFDRTRKSVVAASRCGIYAFDPAIALRPTD